MASEIKPKMVDGEAVCEECEVWEEQYYQREKEIEQLRAALAAKEAECERLMRRCVSLKEDVDSLARERQALIVWLLEHPDVGDLIPLEYKDGTMDAVRTQKERAKSAESRVAEFEAKCEKLQRCMESMATAWAVEKYKLIPELVARDCNEQKFIAKIAADLLVEYRRKYGIGGEGE